MRCVGWFPFLNSAVVCGVLALIFVLTDHHFHLAYPIGSMLFALCCTLFSSAIVFGTECNVPSGAKKCIKCGELPLYTVPAL